MKKLPLLIALLLALALPAPRAAAAPLPTLDMAGLTDLLQKSHGKVVVLNFFATWCPPCRMELPELTKLAGKYGDGQLLVVSLSVDEDRAAVPAFLKKAGIRHRAFMAGDDVVRAFRVTSIPHNALYNRQGRQVLSAPGVLDADTLGEMVEALLRR